MRGRCDLGKKQFKRCRASVARCVLSLATQCGVMKGGGVLAVIADNTSRACFFSRDRRAVQVIQFPFRHAVMI